MLLALGLSTVLKVVDPDFLKPHNSLTKNSGQRVKKIQGVIMETCELTEKGQAGFTFIELMIVLVIFAVLIGMGVPGIKN